MRRWTGWVIGMAACALAGCNMSVPIVTPTVAPTRTPFETATPNVTATTASTTTPTQTDTATPRPTDTASATATSTTTPTPTGTRTPSHTPSDTPTATATPTSTLTPSPTPTLTPTLTFTPTWTLIPSQTPLPSPTPLPIIPTDTPTDTNTPRPTATFTHTPTGTPSPTLTPSITSTFTPRPTATPDVAASRTRQAQVQARENTQFAVTITAEFRSIAATLTALAPTPDTGATLTAQAQIIGATLTALVNAATERAPTMDSTPTVITAAPGTDVPAQQAPADFTPILSGDPQGRGDVETITPEAAPQVANTPAPFFDPPTPLNFENVPPGARSFALSTSGGLGGEYIELPGGASAFAQNPVFPNVYARVDPNGLLYQVDDITTGGVRMSASPFSEFAADAPERNNARVTQVAWSPDGRLLAFVIDTTRDASTDNDLANDGVYFYQPGVSSPHPLFRSCPPQPSCQLVQHDAGPYEFRPTGIEWNVSSTALLIRLELESGAAGFSVVPALTSTNPAALPRVYRFEYASWSNDGGRVLASGAGEDGINGLRWIDPITGDIESIYDAGANGLSMRYAVQRPNGGVVALGTTGAGGWRLYDANGSALTGEIGTSAPARVAWSPDRSAALVVTVENGGARYFVARPNGGVAEITAYAAGTLAVEWVR